MDYLTKWPEAFAISEQSSETLAHLLVKSVICRHGTPNKLGAQTYSEFGYQLRRGNEETEVYRLPSSNRWFG